VSASPPGTWRSAPPFPWPAAVAGRIAVDTGWNPVALEMPGVPRTASAVSAYRPRSPATAGRCRTPVVGTWSAVVSQNSDTAPCQVCSGIEDSEWTPSRVAVYMAAEVTAAMPGIPAGC